jgi:hypothetical protein
MFNVAASSANRHGFSCLFQVSRIAAEGKELAVDGYQLSAISYQLSVIKGVRRSSECPANTSDS